MCLNSLNIVIILFLTAAHFPPQCIDLVNCSYCFPMSSHRDIFMSQDGGAYLDFFFFKSYLTPPVSLCLCHAMCVLQINISSVLTTLEADRTMFKPLWAHSVFGHTAIRQSRSFCSAASNIQLLAATPVFRIKRLEAAAVLMQGDSLCMQPLISMPKRETNLMMKIKATQSPVVRKCIKIQVVLQFIFFNRLYLPKKASFQ